MLRGALLVGSNREFEAVVDIAATCPTYIEVTRLTVGHVSCTVAILGGLLMLELLFSWPQSQARPGQSTSEVGIDPLCACGTQKCNVCRFGLFSFAMRPAQFCHMANLLQQQLVADLEPHLEVGLFQQQQQQQQQQV